MKRILFALVAVAGLAVGCVNEVEDLFDQPASERLQARMVECQKLLTSAANGWMISYYPGSEKDYGGTIFTAKFDADGTVAMTGEVAAQANMGGDVTKVLTSNYSIKSSTGVVLTFDTYNKYFHYWSDPDFTGGNNFGGEFEFSYVSGDENEMIFRGIKTGNRVVFTALDSDIVTTMQNVMAIRDDVVDKLYAGFKLTGSKVVPITPNPATPALAAEGEGAGEVDTTPTLYADDAYNLLIYYPTGNLDGEYVTIPYAYDSEGITLYEPTEVAGVMLHSLKWDTASGTFVAVDATTPDGAATDATMTGYHGEGFMHYDTFLGNYTFVYNGRSRRVTLTENERYKSYTLTNFIPSTAYNYPVEVAYSKSTGRLTITTQVVGMSGSYAYYLCPWALGEGGTFTWSPGVGVNLDHNGDPDNLVLTFSDIPGDAYAIDSFILCRFAGGSYQSYVVQIPNLTSLTKIN